jgi:hypothetical protein
MATRTDPGGKINTNDGIYQLQSKESPACKEFEGKDAPFSNITTGREGVVEDIYGISRNGIIHVGCHQYIESTKPKKRITKDDVGPLAPTPLDKSPVWDPKPRFPQADNNSH